MDKNKYTIYWMTGPHPNAIVLYDMSEALAFMEDMRKPGSGCSSIAWVSEIAGRVGQDGVASVVDGKTPDGQDYSWSKAHRAGATRGAVHSIIDNRSNE